MIDFAYQGMGAGLSEDAAGLRCLIDHLPEMIIAVSSSKNIGLYRERAGAVMFLGGDARAAEAMASQAISAARRVYSMPPAHGALLAGRVLSSPALRSQWEAELAQICQRINGLRREFCDALVTKTDRDFAFIGEEHGMFLFSGPQCRTGSAPACRKVGLRVGLFPHQHCRDSTPAIWIGWLNAVSAGPLTSLTLQRDQPF